MPPIARRSDGGGPCTDSEPAIAREASCQNGTGKLGRRASQCQAGDSYEPSSFRVTRSEEHTSELQSRPHLVCRLLLEKKNKGIVHLPTRCSRAFPGQHPRC